ncbi:MAG: YARHG domain-containing protein, partial [Chitinispirillia bacterium]|nr:YARHG domain-containing protein [Chitinispirillia bacterium]
GRDINFGCTDGGFFACTLDDCQNYGSWHWDKALLYSGPSDIRMFTKAQVRLFINHFFAMHGYDFKNAYYKDYFQNLKSLGNGKKYEVNPKFSEKSFNEFERKNVDFLLKMEKMIPAPSIASFTDARDGRVYRTVKIGNQTWMAENLNFVTDSSACYDNADSNCTKYGRLYNWDDAMKACPAPWRVPSDEDWDNLTLAVGGQREEDGYGGYDWKFAGKKLKSTTGWKDREDDDGNLVSGNGTDEFGFSALPGGGGTSGGDFCCAGYYSAWWSATENDASNAWYRFMSYYYDYVLRFNNYKTFLYSVRCVRDFAAPQ